MSALKLERELRVIDTKQMQDRGVQVMNMHRIARDVVTEVVGLTDAYTGLDSCTCQPNREATRMMVATVIVGS